MARGGPGALYSHELLGLLGERILDCAITGRLEQALATVDVRVLDHMVVGNGETVSFADRGWL